nr:uncharacterized protein LOC128699295 [Cherax quadricarinatus]XP_053647875.1 uncharacterized protein LOC128699295 [Cherax quadricarinatus]XP_053647876.1 uncharacterized protein LOC128699295 [Cherax quadricarinatus]XP_053647877.1 uncharacterized protein LOC128699295 [Cherax quadricarinatus]
MGIGSPISAVLANLYMEYLESEHFANIIPSSVTWLHYVDDVLLITPTCFDVQNLQARLNAVEPVIQFTLEEESNDKLPFLDVLIHKVDNSLRFQVYRKPTNKNNLTLFYSSQDTRTKRGNIIGFFLRGYRICSPEFLDEECTYIHQTFTDLHFPSFFIKDCKTRALQIINSSCTNTTPNNVIILPNSQVALNVSKVLSQANTRVAIASSTSIKDLTRTKSKHHEPVNAGVYTIPCGGCDKIYVGETARNLNTRLSEHIYACRNDNLNNACVQHRNSTNHLMKFREAQLVIKETNFCRHSFTISEVLARILLKTVNPAIT